VLISSPDCKYCAASVPFYQELGELASASSGRLALRVVMPVPQQEARAYLIDRGLAWTVSVLDFRALGITQTPTLLLVDTSRRVSQAWVGLLTDAQESEVIDAARRLCSCLPNTARTGP
jgi:hypothetical protein